MDIEQRMRTALLQGAERLQLPEPGPTAARDRARRRMRRRQAGAGGVAAIVVVVGAITASQYLPTHQVQFDSAAGAGDGATGAVLDDLHWRDADGIVGNAKEVVQTADGIYFALSTAPGARREDHPDGAVPQALYRSADGLSWEVADLGEDPWVADLEERGGVLYAVSTAPATRGEGTGQIGVSTDGGQTWAQADLPSTATPPDADVALQGPFTRAGIAVGESGMLAVTSSTYRIAGEDVFSAAELHDDRAVLTTAAGVELFDASCGESTDPAAAGAPPQGAGAPEAVPEPRDEADRAVSSPCAREDAEPLRTVPWSELGLASAADLRVDELFRSDDGERWEAIDAGALARRDMVDITAGPQGFFAVTRSHEADGSSSVELLRSADGTAWEEVRGMGAVSALGFVGERIVGTTTSGHGEQGEVEAVASGDGGATWTRTDLAELVDPDGTGEAIAVVAQDAGTLGAAVVTAAYPDEPSQPGAAELTLLTSADGVHWSVTPLADIVDGEPSSVSWVAVGDDSIVLTAAWPRDGEAPVRTRTFVGTPTR